MAEGKGDQEWLFDMLWACFKSPQWDAPVQSFIDEFCVVFASEEENSFSHTEVHNQFREMIEGLLAASLTEVGTTDEEFVAALKSARFSRGMSEPVYQQLRALDDFVVFKKIMVKRNMELELEAVRALKRKGWSLARIINRGRSDAKDDDTAEMDSKASSDDENSDGGDGGDGDDSSAAWKAALHADIMELNVLRRREEMERRELEQAIALSLAAVGEERDHGALSEAEASAFTATIEEMIRRNIEDAAAGGGKSGNGGGTGGVGGDGGGELRVTGVGCDRDGAAGAGGHCGSGYCMAGRRDIDGAESKSAAGRAEGTAVTHGWSEDEGSSAKAEPQSAVAESKTGEGRKPRIRGGSSGVGDRDARADAKGMEGGSGGGLAVAGTAAAGGFLQPIGGGAGIGDGTGSGGGRLPKLGGEDRARLASTEAQRRSSQQTAPLLRSSDGSGSTAGVVVDGDVPEDAEARARHLREMRDRIVAKKRAEREEEALKAAGRSGARPDGGASSSGGGDAKSESKKNDGGASVPEDEAERQRREMRAALSRRMKRDLLTGGGSGGSGGGGGRTMAARPEAAAAEQLDSLAAKLRLVEQMAEENRAREEELARALQSQQARRAGNVLQSVGGKGAGRQDFAFREGA